MAAPLEAMSPEGASGSGDALARIVDELMDVTVGRYQTIAFQSSTSVLPDFLAICRRDVSRLLDAAAKATRRAMQAKLTSNTTSAPSPRPHEGDSGAASPRGSSIADGGDDDEIGPAAAIRIAALENEVAVAKSKELAFRSIASEVTRDLAASSQEVLMLQGVIRKRDTLLNDQRKAYYRELTHLREMMRLWQQKGSTALGDASLYNWGNDDLAQQLAEEQLAKLEAVREEEQQLHQKEMETLELKHAKMQEELRQRVAQLESLLLSHTVKVVRADVAEQTMEVVHLEVAVETDPVEFATAPASGVDDGSGVDVVDPSTVDEGVETVEPSPSPKRSRRSTAATEAVVEEAKVVHIVDDNGATELLLQGDIELLRKELSKLRQQLGVAKTQLQARDKELAVAAKQRAEESARLRTQELQLRRKYEEQLKAKEALLSDKAQEMHLLQEETARWFQQYRMSQPPDQAPINYTTLRRMNQAVQDAEQAEEEYRVASWELLARDVKRRHALEALQAECEEADAARDLPTLRMTQRHLDIISHHLWDQLTRHRQRRVRLRHFANKRWDQVLLLARSVMHQDEPVGPPPRYYGGGDASSAADEGVLASPKISRPQQLRSIMAQAHTPISFAPASSVGATRTASAAAAQRPGSASTLADTRRVRSPAKTKSPRGSGGPLQDLHTSGETEGWQADDGPSFHDALLPTQHLAGPPPASIVSAVTVQVRQELRPVSASAQAAGRAPTAPPAAFVVAPASGTVRYRAGGTTRPSSAHVGAAASSSGPAAGPVAFSPSKLRGLSQAEQRQELLRLMRSDQDNLAITKQRHIDQHYRAKAASGGPAAPRAPHELASGIHLFKLVGRNE